MAFNGKRLLLPSLATVALLGLLRLLSHKPVADPPPGETTTARVVRGTLRTSVSCTGRVAARLEVEVRARGGGIIVALPHDVNDVVRAGDLLMAIDQTEQERALKQAQLARDAAEVRLAQARARAAVAEQTLPAAREREQTALDAARQADRDAKQNVERLHRLLAKGLVSKAEFAAAEAASIQARAQLSAAAARVGELESGELGLGLQRQEIALAHNQLETARMEVAGARARLSERRVNAPIDGVVTRRSAQVGQLVAPGPGGGSASMTISDLSRLFVLAAVDESDIGRVKEGQDATITTDAYPGRPFAGRVVAVASRGLNTSNVVTFETRIELLDARPPQLKPEMTANVQIVAEERVGVLLAPAGALYRAGGRSLVRVLTEAGIEERDVDPGVSDGAQQEIRGGLREGESVVLRPATGNGGEGLESGAGRQGSRKKFWMLGS